MSALAYMASQRLVNNAPNLKHSPPMFPFALLANSLHSLLRAALRFPVTKLPVHARKSNRHNRYSSQCRDAEGPRAGT